jgi:YD repeat-containing protein
MAEGVRLSVKDANGVTFEPGACDHQFSYDANGNLLVDTAIENGAIVRQKARTFTQINGTWFAATESRWINVTETWQG